MLITKSKLVHQVKLRIQALIHVWIFTELLILCRAADAQRLGHKLVWVRSLCDAENYASYDVTVQSSLLA